MQYVRVNTAALILTHEGAGAAYEAEKAAFRWESSTFTAMKTERRGGGVVSAGWGKVQVQSSPNQVHDPVLVFDP